MKAEGNKTNVYSVQLGQELTFMPNLRLKIDSTLKGTLQHKYNFALKVG